jgi:hypothetical protein
MRDLASVPQSRIISRNVVRRTDGPPLTCVPCPSVNTCLPHAPPAGIGSALALVKACQGQLLFWDLKDAFGHPNPNEAAGTTLMRVDLQQVDAEIAALRSRLAAINDDLDECRIGYFEHPRAWSQMRRMLTSERHRVQRRLDEFTFARECVGGRQRRSIATPSFRSLEGFDRLTFRVIQGGRS